MAQHKLGFFTASTIAPLLTGKGSALLTGGVEFAKRIALERIGVVNEDEFFNGNKATQWGNEHELEAIQAFESHNFIKTFDHQKTVEKGWLSCTPDGYIGTDELIEVKCPFSPLIHLNNILENGLNQYYHQVQFQMMLTERKICHLVSYDPRFKDKNSLYSIKIHADIEWQNMCIDRIQQAESIIEDVLNKLNIN
jgi:hypothetical protein